MRSAGHKGKRISFRLPETIKNEEAIEVIRSIVKGLDDLSPGDIPQLHRMATAYDTYLSCVKVISSDGMTMKNLKGETVKRPEVNIMRESWSQYLDIAKEYGFTPRSKKMTKGASSDNESYISPADDFFNNR